MTWSELVIRLRTGWTLARVLYMFMGSYIMIRSATDGQWALVFFGAYFFAMGLFGFGCAGGACRR